MAISFVGSASSNSGTTNGGVTTLSVTMPVVLAGDLALFILSKGATATPSAPTGFTISTSLSTGTTNSTYVWYKVLDGTEDGVSFTTSWTTAAYSAAAIVVYRGIDTTTPFDATTTTATKTTASTTTTFPSITTVIGDSQIVHVIGSQMGAATSGAITYTNPASPTHNQRVTSSSARNSSVNVGLNVSDYATTSPGVTTGTQNGSESPSSVDGTLTIALRASTTFSATGSGSLSLSGSASVSALVTGTASLSLSATGVMRPIISGSAGQITLSAIMTARLRFIGWGRPL